MRSSTSALLNTSLLVLGVSLSSAHFLKPTNKRRVQVTATLGDACLGEQCAPEGSMAMGCFVHHKEDRLRKEGVVTESNYNAAAEFCRDTCKQRNPAYTHFGMEFGKGCFCGFAGDQPVEKVDADECDYPCVGDGDKMCGRHDRISMFEYVLDFEYVGKEEEQGDSSKLKLGEHDGVKRLGCFKYSREDKRVLAGPREKSDTDMSAKFCATFCKDYKYFGMENTKQCFCGGVFAGVHTLDDNVCNHPCTGDTSVACGGDGAISVFKFNKDSIDFWDEDPHDQSAGNFAEDSDDGELVDPVPENVIGCFVGGEDGSVLDLLDVYVDDEMTPENCYSHCEDIIGAVYYGVQDGDKCSCGGKDSTLAESLVLDPRNCDFECPGDHAQLCGGIRAIAVYGPDIEIA